MLRFILFFLILGSFFSFSQNLEKILHSERRNSIQEVLPYLDQIDNESLSDPLLENYIKHDLPRLINSMEKYFPEAIYSFLGRDTSLIADIFESYFILKGMPHRVHRIGASGPSFLSATNEDIYQFIKTDGFDINNLKHKAPYLILDVINHSYGGMQPRQIFNVIFEKYLASGNKDVKMFLEKFNIIGLNNFNEASNFDLSGTTEKLSNQLRNYKIGLKGKNILNDNILYFDLKYYRPSYEHHAWHDSFSSFYKYGEKVYAKPGNPSSKNIRESILKKQKSIYNYIKENFQEIDQKISLKNSSRISKTKAHDLFSIEFKNNISVSFTQNEMKLLEILMASSRIPSNKDIQNFLSKASQNLVKKLLITGKNNLNEMNNNSIHALSQSSSYSIEEIQKVRNKFLFMYAQKIINDLENDKKLQIRLFSRDMDDIYQKIELLLSEDSLHLNLNTKNKEQILKRVKLVNISRPFAQSVKSLEELKFLLRITDDEIKASTRLNLIDIGYSGTIPNYLKTYTDHLKKEIPVTWSLLWKSNTAPSYIDSYVDESFNLFLKKRYPILATSTKFTGDESFRVGAIEHQARWTNTVTNYNQNEITICFDHDFKSQNNLDKKYFLNELNLYKDFSKRITIVENGHADFVIKNGDWSYYQNELNNIYQSLFDATLSSQKDRLLLLSETLLSFLDPNHSKNFELQKDVLSERELIKLKITAHKIHTSNEYMEKITDLIINEKKTTYLEALSIIEKLPEEIQVKTLSLLTIKRDIKSYMKFIGDYIDKGYNLKFLFKDIFSEDEIASMGEHILKVAEIYIKKGSIKNDPFFNLNIDELIKIVFSRTELINTGEPFLNLLKIYIDKNKRLYPLVESVFSKPEFIDQGESALKIIEHYINKGNFESKHDHFNSNMGDLAKYTLSQPKLIAMGKPYLKLLQAYIQKGQKMGVLAYWVFTKPELISMGEPYLKLLQAYIDKGEHMNILAESVLSKPELISMGEPYLKLLQAYIDKDQDIISLKKYLPFNPNIQNLLEKNKPSFFFVQDQYSIGKEINLEWDTYKILSILGKGKRSTVYLVENKNSIFKQLRALKVANDDSAETKNSFAKETQKVEALNKLGLKTATIYHSNYLYILKEYIEGERADEWIQRLEKENKLNTITSTDQFKKLNDIVHKISSQNKYVGDLNRKNLIWSKLLKDWVIIDSGSIQNMKPEDSLKKLVENISTRWSKSLDITKQSTCNKLFLNSLGK